MSIIIRCECGKEFETRDENAGRRGRCPACQRELIVPHANARAESDFARLHELPPPSMSAKAVMSFVLGLFFCLGCVSGITAVIFGIMGLTDISNPKKNLTGRAFAITGIVLGGLWSLVFVPVMLIILMIPAVGAAREAARRAQCTNNLKQIGLALLNYESSYGTFPPTATFDANGKPLLSWRVLVLPYLDQNPLYQQFHLDEPWDSPHNKPLSDIVLNVYQCPSTEPSSRTSTPYQVIVDPRSIFTGKPVGVALDAVTDGPGNTVLVVEAAKAVPWTKPDDLAFTPANDPTIGMGSNHTIGLNALFADGSVRFLKSTPTNPLSPRVLQGIVTRNGGEVFQVP